MSCYCNICGNEIPENERFCPVCGSEVVARQATTANSFSAVNQSNFADSEIHSAGTVAASQSTKKKNWYSDNWRRVFNQPWKTGAGHHIAWIFGHIGALAVISFAVFIIVSEFVIAVNTAKEIVGITDAPKIVQSAEERTIADSSNYFDDQAATETSSEDNIIDKLTGKSAIKNAQVGDIITFGQYEQDGDSSNGMEDLEWEVLDVEDGKALLITRYVIDQICYNEKHEEVTWETCSLRQWLNEEFYNNAFSSKEQSYILETDLKNEDNQRYGTEGGNDTVDKVFCLSVSEILKYYKFNEYNEDEKRGYSQELVTAPTEYAKKMGVYYYTFGWEDDDKEWLEDMGYSLDMIGSTGAYWWLRSPSYDSYDACPVDGIGYTDAFGYWDDDVSTGEGSGVRPALWISIE
ncbi:MAG: zinc ribbon domain-containing protein [Lachnospiraceae bacterium]|nr:zinc ribbon domain-containing protein [Lachnospiraceae bacterium]